MNHLLIILDSVSYDVFQKAKAKNIRKLGEIGKAYTPSHWTIPTIVSIFYNSYYMGKPLVILDTYIEHLWLPERMKKSGYNTSLISDNPWFVLCRSFIIRGFDNYITYNMIDTKPIVRETMKHLIPPFFTVVWITETHHGLHIRDGNLYGQTIKDKIDMIEKVDNLLEPLFKKVPPNTEIVVTADHGDSYRSDSSIIGHEPRILKEFDKNLFEVFFVRQMR